MHKEMKIMSYTAFTVRLWLWLWPWKLNHPDFHFLLPEVPDWTDLYYIPRETKERAASTTHSSPVYPSPVLSTPQLLGGCFSHSSIVGHFAFLAQGFMTGTSGVRTCLTGLLLLVLDRWIHSRVHLPHARVKWPQKYILLWLCAPFSTC